VNLSLESRTLRALGFTPAVGGCPSKVSHRVLGMECIQMELCEPDDSGRRRPVPMKGSEFVMDLDTVIVAIGNKPNPLVPRTTPELQTTKWGTVVADPQTMQTSIPGVFAGGDIVSGAATVILAMGQGRIAAQAMDRYLRA
jgi:glutamate synthase (NADPH/NADH) small chain